MGPPKSAPEHYLGMLVGQQFTLERLIGLGGSAWVYQAITAAGWNAAVKILHTTKPTARLRFDREIRVLKVLPHSPFVPRYVAHGWTDDERPYLAIDYVDGITLKEGMRRNPRRSTAVALDLVINLCQAFSGLHELGVAHRDVKPANVLLPRRGGVSLIDFGLIRDAQGLLQLFEETDPLQSPVFNCEIDQWLLAGTPEYMAPEQFSDALSSDGGPGSTDTWSDVFSLGVILFELLTGRKPFPMPRASSRRTNDDYLTYARWRRSLTDLDTPPCSGIDMALESILKRALRRDPRRRQRDARELEAELQKYVSSGIGADDDESQTLPAAAAGSPRPHQETTERLLAVAQASPSPDHISTERTITPFKKVITHEAAIYEDGTLASDYPSFAAENEPPTIREPKRPAGAPPPSRRPDSTIPPELEELDQEVTLPMDGPPSTIKLIAEELPTSIERQTDVGAPPEFANATEDVTIEPTIEEDEDLTEPLPGTKKR